jgi:hypothetical protein
MKNFLIKNKGVIIVAVIALTVIVLSRFVSQKSPVGENKQSGPSITSSPTPFEYVSPKYNNAPPKETLDAVKIASSTELKKKLIDQLPIYIESFQISNGKKTTLNVYSSPSDPEYIIHVDIYGIDYENQDINKKSNPDVTAFIESFNEIKTQLSGRGVDLAKMYFVFGSREYIQKTAELWIKTFKLL